MLVTHHAIRSRRSEKKKRTKKNSKGKGKATEEERLQKASRVPGLRLSRVERDVVSIGAVHTSMYRCDARRRRTSLT